MQTHQDGLDTHAENLEEHAGHPEGQDEAQEHRSDDAADVVVVQRIDDRQVAHKRGHGRDEDLTMQDRIIIK